MWFTRHNCRVQAVLLQSVNLSQSSAVNQVMPKEGIKIVTGQETAAGHVNFRAVIDALKSLRKQGILVANVRKTNPFLADRLPACKFGCCHPLRLAHHRLSHLSRRLFSAASEQCKDHAAILYGQQRLAHHAQCAYTTYHYLFLQLRLDLHTVRPLHQTIMVPSFPLATCTPCRRPRSPFANQ